MNTTSSTEVGGDAAHLANLLGRLRKTASTSRADLTRDTGLGRATVSQHIDELLCHGIIRETGVGESSGGRRPRLLRFRSEAGLIGAIDLGVTSLDVAITDLSAHVLAHHSEEASVTAGPLPVLQRSVELLDTLLASKGFRGDALWGIGMGVPGPVEFSTGMPVSPPIMPGWEAFPIRDFWSDHFLCPAYVDNDANLLALGEASVGIGVGVDNFIYVKVGTGIGAGIIVQGEIYRGSQGCAGEIGHIQVDDRAATDVVCRCGNLGCLEAVAGGAAFARMAEAAARAGQSPLLRARLTKKGFLTAADVSEMARAGDSWSTEQIRASGHQLGHTLAGLVNFFNPSLIVIGGGVANVGDSFLAAIREMVYRRSLPLATRSLRIERSTLGSLGGITGAAHVALDELFSSQNVISVLNRHSVSAA